MRESLKSRNTKGEVYHKYTNCTMAALTQDAAVAYFKNLRIVF
jgi:hypothetical protein